MLLGSLCGSALLEEVCHWKQVLKVNALPTGLPLCFMLPSATAMPVARCPVSLPSWLEPEAQLTLLLSWLWCLITATEEWVMQNTVQDPPHFKNLSFAHAFTADKMANKGKVRIGSSSTGVLIAVFPSSHKGEETNEQQASTPLPYRVSQLCGPSHAERLLVSVIILRVIQWSRA